MDKPLELRFMESSNIKLNGDDDPKIVGTIPYNSLSRDLGGFREIIRPGAFSRSLEKGNEVRALFSHDPKKRMARRSTGTLELRDTPTGLDITISPNKTSWANDAIELVKHGDADGFSFGFDTIRDNFQRGSDGLVVRELIEVAIEEISIVFNPAYSEGSIAIRVLPETTEKVAELQEEKELEVAEPQAEEKQLEQKTATPEPTPYRMSTKMLSVVQKQKKLALHKICNSRIDNKEQVGRSGLSPSRRNVQ